jgi:hypothetical protein
MTIPVLWSGTGKSDDTEEAKNDAPQKRSAVCEDDGAAIARRGHRVRQGSGDEVAALDRRGARLVGRSPPADRAARAQDTAPRSSP